MTRPITEREKLERALETARWIVKTTEANPDSHAGLVARALLTTSDALKACEGYLLNAKIDLETGTKKATTIATLEGGLRRVRAALSPKGEG